MKRLSPRTIAATIALFAPIPLIGCIPLTPEQRGQLSEVAIGVAHDNIDNGLPDATVFCYSEGPYLDETYMVTSVDSSDLLRYGSCRMLWLHGTGATTCDFETRFCRIFPEPPPPTTTVTVIDYGPAQ